MEEIHWNDYPLEAREKKCPEQRPMRALQALSRKTDSEFLEKREGIFLGISGDDLFELEKVMAMRRTGNLQNIAAFSREQSLTNPKEKA